MQSCKRLRRRPNGIGLKPNTDSAASRPQEGQAALAGGRSGRGPEGSEQFSREQRTPRGLMLLDESLSDQGASLDEPGVRDRVVHGLAVLARAHEPALLEDPQVLRDLVDRYAKGHGQGADIDGFSHLHLIYWLHRASEVASSVAGPLPLKVIPYLDDVPRGVFATRTPGRPNPIGLSLVRLAERHGNVLVVEDLDVLDRTPLLDIKLYVEKFDLRVGTRGGWTDRVGDPTFRQRGERREDAK